VPWSLRRSKPPPVKSRIDLLARPAAVDGIQRTLWRTELPKPHDAPPDAVLSGEHSDQ
jgi:hypothetical protein